MIHLTRSLVRRWLSALLHIQDTPERTAAAFALGVFFGFSPFLGLHTRHGDRARVPPEPEPGRGPARRLLEPAVDHRRRTTPRRRCSAPPSSGPVCLPDFATGWPTCSSCRSSRAGSGSELARLLTPLLWPFTVGSTIGAVVLAAAAYPLALAFVKSRKHLQEIIHHKPPS